MLYIREPTSRPSIPQPLRRWQIFFRHPGYDDSNNVLFKLYAVDTDTDDNHNNEQDASQPSGLPGLYAQLALDACAIITGNRTDGWLSTSRDLDDARSARIDAASILHARNYYFHLDCGGGTDGESDELYPVVPIFREWRFPHDRIPAHWQQVSPDATPLDSIYSPSNLTTALQIRDGSCRISGRREELQVAHIVPQAELDWWRGNDMSRYNLGPADTPDDTANAMFLRADLHIAFDKSRFIFVPKPSSDGSGMRLFFHLLEPSGEYEYFYHNRELHASAVGVEMLYARFAWSLFPLLGAFLCCRTNRRLTCRTAVDGLADCHGFFTAAFCEQVSLSATRKRSQSPEERKPDDDAVAGNMDIDDSKVCEQAQAQDESNIFVPTLDPQRRAYSHATTEPSAWSRAHKRSRGQKSSPSSPSGHSHASSMTSTNISPLAHEWLKKERQHSDIRRTWAEDSCWAQEVWAGKSLAYHELPRWFNVSGFDSRDTEHENG